MDINIKLTIDLSEETKTYINNLLCAGGSLPEAAKATPQKTAKVEKPTEEQAKEIQQKTAAGSGDEIPEFATDAAEREWYVEKLTSMGVEIPPRTRTNTLKKKYAQLIEAAGASDKSGSDDTASDSGKGAADDKGAGDSVPSVKAVSEALRSYIAAGGDDKAERRNAVKAKLKEFGAEQVNQLKEADRQTVIDAFTE